MLTVFLSLLLAICSGQHRDLTANMDTEERVQFTLRYPHLEWNLKSTSGSIKLTCTPQEVDCKRSGGAVIVIKDGARILQRPICATLQAITTARHVSISIGSGILTDSSTQVICTAYKSSIQLKRSFNLSSTLEELDSSEHGGPPGLKLTTCPCGWRNRADLRIVNGSETGANEYPFAVALASCQSLYQFFGGSLLTDRHVLTAAHCTQHRTALEMCAIAGEHNLYSESGSRQVVKVNRIVQHEGYDDDSLQHDISLLVLAKSVQFTNLVGPVCLTHNKIDLIVQYVKIMGWGNLKAGGPSSDVLQKVTVRVIPLPACQQVYDFIDIEKPTQICIYAQMKSSCQGDSGGPVVWLDPETNRFVQVGIVSFATICANEDPTVHTNLLAYYDWIVDNIKGSRRSAELCLKM